MANTITLTGVAVNPSQKVTVPAQTVKVTIPSQTVNVTIAAQTVNVPASNDVVTFTLDLQSLATALLPYLSVGVNTNTTNSGSNTNTTNTVVSSNTFWVYSNGTFNWAGDFSWETGPINYHDTVGQPVNGPTDISVPIIGPWGGFQPFAPGANFDTTPYNYLIFSIKPTQPNAIFAIGFAANNDVADGKAGIIVAASGVTKYGPEPQVGVWGNYKIPLADVALTNPLILKFAIADGTGVQNNQFYVNDIGFAVS